MNDYEFFYSWDLSEEEVLYYKNEFFDLTKRSYFKSQDHKYSFCYVDKNKEVITLFFTNDEDTLNEPFIFKDVIFFVPLQNIDSNFKDFIKQYYNGELV